MASRDRVDLAQVSAAEYDAQRKRHNAGLRPLSLRYRITHVTEPFDDSCNYFNRVHVSVTILFIKYN